MSKPHVCPVCQGRGGAILPLAGSENGLTTVDPCPACKGACVLWEPKPDELAEIVRRRRKDLAEDKAIQRTCELVRILQKVHQKTLPMDLAAIIEKVYLGPPICSSPESYILGQLGRREAPHAVSGER